MAISGNNLMMNMSISVKELNDKHQLNPNNTGVSAIDRCMCLLNGDLGISDILSIRVFEEASLFEIRLSNATLHVPDYCRVMKASGEYGSISEGNLKKADTLIVVNADGSKRSEYIQDIYPTALKTLIYKIKTHRKNYILSSGIVVESD